MNTAGADVRFDSSSALIENNLISGRIKERDNGRHVAQHNQVGDSVLDLLPASGSFDFNPQANPSLTGARIQSTMVDICGRMRTHPRLTLGAIETINGDRCDVTQQFGLEPII